MMIVFQFLVIFQLTCLAFMAAASGPKLIRSYLGEEEGKTSWVFLVLLLLYFLFILMSSALWGATIIRMLFEGHALSRFAIAAVPAGLIWMVWIRSKGNRHDK
jgi:hypothetical protein